MKLFSTYTEAINYAEKTANQYQRPYGISKAGPLDGNGFYVFPIPAVGNRYGRDAQCEAVEPSVK